jgi:phosphoribosylanthranilate isomerase
VQLHGDETPHLCEQVSNEVETIKTFRIDHKSETLIDYILKDYDEVCDYYLFDTDAKPAVGENLKLSNWKQIAESKIEKPFFLSGGIGPDDAKLVKKFKHPDYYGVDINGLFNKEPGVKDMALILQFIHGLK